MSDTELLDFMEQQRWIPMPLFRARATTTPNQWAVDEFAGWVITGSEQPYPTLRAALIAMAKGKP